MTIEPLESVEPVEPVEPPLPGPAEPGAETTPVVGTPSPVAGLQTTPRAVLVAALDLLTRASTDIRRGSFYVGLIVLGTIGPVVVLLWGLEVAAQGQEIDDVGSFLAGRAGEWLLVAGWLAFGGLLVAFVESRGVAIALLGARLDGRPFTIHDAVQRSRTVFWRVLGGIALINIPVVIAQAFVAERLAAAFGGDSEVTAISAAIILAIVASPFAYVLTGIVLGDVGAVEAARRSVTLFKARRLTAVVVSLFALAAQFLTLFGASAGLGLVAQAFDALALGPGSGSIGIAAITVVIIAVVFALGSLLFTVAAIAAAPQVVSFLALTHATLGLDRVTAPGPADPYLTGRRKFRWLTLPMRGAMLLGLVGTVLGLLALER